MYMYTMKFWITRMIVIGLVLVIIKIRLFNIKNANHLISDEFKNKYKDLL